MEAGCPGDAGPAAAAQLSNPTGLVFDRAGNLFIGDGGSVRMIPTGGLITTVVGDGAVGFSGDGGAAAIGAIGAWGLAFDSAGGSTLPIRGTTPGGW